MARDWEDGDSYHTEEGLWDRGLEAINRGNKRISGWSQVAGGSEGNKDSRAMLYLSPCSGPQWLVPPDVFNFHYRNLGWGEGWHKAYLCYCLEHLARMSLHSRDMHRQARSAGTRSSRWDVLIGYLFLSSI